ncbi:hypothetical protein S7335_1288 [Synechococcus sp. PCC 7335]|uniref:hypothetical protein n=1 Tax=Synechococcus sp. (strain ATCC 29403 / PCC 7335) TaxID=91464 RepID=UPI00017EB562|nr:hypothetical protein [Synechococcus sp. PCC 7335]EDX82584.1 hypothetical protein S7335_1288 [Synechococcus sp. PCC 7335]
MATLKEFSEQLSIWRSSHNLWTVIQHSGFNEIEQQAVARSVALTVLKQYCNEYQNPFYVQVEALYPHRRFGLYITEKTPVPVFAGRRSKKRTRAVLGWLYAFLSVTGQMKLLRGFEERIACYIDQKL